MVFAYLRVSTEQQSQSIDAQKRAVQAYCDQKGITQIRFFEDVGVSGAKAKRPGLEALMEAVRSEGCETVVCYSISRLGRSVVHLLRLVQELDELGVAVHSLTESIDTKSPFGRLILNILASLAQMERELIVSRTLTGLEGAKARGKRLGRPQRRNASLIRELHSKGYKRKDIARLASVSPATVSRELNNFFQKGA